MTQAVVDALIEVPGLKVTIEHDGYDYHIPAARIQFLSEWRGPSRDRVFTAMTDGEPPIYLNALGNPDELAVDPLSLDEQELQVVIQRLCQELLGLKGSADHG